MRPKKNQIKNNKPKTNNQRGPTYKTAYKPKPKSLCSQLLRQVTMNVNKGESMIKARHNYMKKSNKVTSENYVDTEKCNDEIDDITTDRSPKAKKQKTGEVIEGLIWSIEAESALKQIESLAENSQISELINCFDTEGAEINKFEKTQEDIKKCTQTWHEKEKSITKAIELINDDGTIDKLRTLQYNELVTCLVHTINNRMPKKCKDCNELYKIDIGSQPLFRCMLCNVGMHNCKKMDKNLMVSGLSWMCHGCSVTSKENNIIENAKMQIINKTINGNQLKGKIENKRNNEVKEKNREKRKREE
ncbi:unnamed protein product, partial [Meganyctiphanes norvegica]